MIMFPSLFSKRVFVFSRAWKTERSFQRFYCDGSWQTVSLDVIPVAKLTASVIAAFIARSASSAIFFTSFNLFLMLSFSQYGMIALEISYKTYKSSIEEFKGMSHQYCSHSKKDSSDQWTVIKPGTLTPAGQRYIWLKPKIEEKNWVFDFVSRSIFTKISKWMYFTSF